MNKMKILGYTYSVLQSNDGDFLDASGRFHHISQTIHIANDLNNEQKESTLLHEIIEALNYHLSLELSENTIMSLEAGLYQVLSDNGVDISPLLKS